MERDYKYQSTWKGTLMGVLFFVPCTIVLACKASLNDRGVILSGLIELSPFQATLFYWLLATLSAGFVVLGGIMALELLFIQRRLTLSDRSLIIPATLFTEAKTLFYSDILSLSPQSIGNQRLLTIVHRQGKFHVQDSMLPQPRDFDEICDVLAQQVAKCAAVPSK